MRTMSIRLADDIDQLEMTPLSEAAAKSEIEESLAGDTRSGQGLCLIAALGVVFWAVFFLVVI